LASLCWDNCPTATKFQVDQLVSEFRNRLGHNLTGVYLHGSLATGCFNPAKSDIDLLAITRYQLVAETKERLIETLLSVSNAPHPLEISFVCLGDLLPWQYPTPFDLHYSEDWREKYESDLNSDRFQYWPIAEQRDSDLAAHITMTKRRGVRLWGEPIEQVFPDVPHKDFAASITSDLEWASKRLDKNPVYGVLNACRICAYFKDALILSKSEGAEWALANTPPQFHSVISSALEAYRSSEQGVIFPKVKEARQLLGHVVSVIKATGQPML